MTLITEWSTSRLFGLKKNINDNRVNTIQIDAENIPEKLYAQYDVVIMVALIEHLIDPMGAMIQLKNILKPGGNVYIDTPNMAKYTRRIKLSLGQFPSTASKNEGLLTYDNQKVDLYDEGHLHYFTYRSLSLMLTNYCGFSKAYKATPYMTNPSFFSNRINFMLAKKWPEMFSEITMIARS